MSGRVSGLASGRLPSQQRHYNRGDAASRSKRCGCLVGFEPRPTTMVMGRVFLPLNPKPYVPKRQSPESLYRNPFP